MFCLMAARHNFEWGHQTMDEIGGGEGSNPPKEMSGAFGGDWAPASLPLPLYFALYLAKRNDHQTEQTPLAHWRSILRGTSPFLLVSFNWTFGHKEMGKNNILPEGRGSRVVLVPKGLMWPRANSSTKKVEPSLFPSGHLLGAHSVLLTWNYTILG